MASADVVSPAGPGGCPVLQGFNPMDREQVDDPGPLMTIARREAPVFFSPEFGFYVVTRHEDVAHIMSDMRLFAGLSLTELEVPERARDVLPQGFLGRRAGMLAWNDADEHGRIRKLAQRAFTRKAARANEQRIRDLFDATVDEFIGHGEADLIPVFARRCPMRVMTAILGIDPSTEDDLHLWTRDTMRLMGDPTLREEALVELAYRQADFERFVTDLIAQRRAAPRPEGDLISDLLRSQDDDGGRGLEDDEIFATVALSIVAGGDTSVNLIGQLVARLLDGDGALWRELDADRSKLDLVIEEELRHSNVGRLAFRRPTEDVEVGGVPIPAGSLIGIHLWSTGRDEAVFDDPDRFDPDRPQVERHLGFGRGARFCMGAPLARLETRVAIEVLMDRLPNPRIVPGNTVRREISIAIPSLLDGLVVAWDVP
jgi:cytochrome P450